MVRIRLAPAESRANFPVQGRARISDRVYTSRRAGLPTCWLMITGSGNVPTVCLDGDLRRGGDARGRHGALVGRQFRYVTEYKCNTVWLLE